MKSLPEISRDLVLVGGGHSQAIALKLLAEHPIPGVRITLVSDTSHTPYSGMLPGYISGFYDFDQTHIDLRMLAQFAQAQFYLDRLVGLDLDQSQVLLANHPPLTYDYLSLNIGSTPNLDQVSGASSYAIPIKPVPQFLEVWDSILTRSEQFPNQPLTVSIVGGGAGGVELALNLDRRLRSSLKDRLTIHLVHSGSKLLPSHHNPWASQELARILPSRGIKLHLATKVKEVFPDSILTESGVIITADYIFWVTQASAPSWLKDTGLATDDQGFILVKDTLQSVSHPQVFATGDIAIMVNYPRPKAGVFAVRQGKPLFTNLRNILEEKPLVPYHPQRRYLSLIGTGNREAIALRGRWGWRSPLLWRWKDYIDRQFMAQFSHLAPLLPAKLYCGGCGAKVGSTTLHQVLANSFDGELDDAALVELKPGTYQAHTIDYLPSLISDPYLFAQIATHHSLNDLFATGATPQTALALVTIPYTTPEKAQLILQQVLSGIQQVLQQHQVNLLGGHTTVGPQLGVGLSAQGLVESSQVLRKGGLEHKQGLILTKPLGTGTLFAALMRCAGRGRWIDRAVESMLISNQRSVQIFLNHGATGATDISGFGLIGHLGEMVKASGIGLELDLDRIPLLPGATDTIAQGYLSSLHSQNLDSLALLACPFPDSPLVDLLVDPQTAGGLVASLPLDQVESCLRDLRSAGYPDSSLIGRAIASPGVIKLAKI